MCRDGRGYIHISLGEFFYESRRIYLRISANSLPNLGEFSYESRRIHLRISANSLTNLGEFTYESRRILVWMGRHGREYVHLGGAHGGLFVHDSRGAGWGVLGMRCHVEGSSTRCHVEGLVAALHPDGLREGQCLSVPNSTNLGEFSCVSRRILVCISANSLMRAGPLLSALSAPKMRRAVDVMARSAPVTVNHAERVSQRPTAAPPVRCGILLRYSRDTAEIQPRYSRDSYDTIPRCQVRAPR